MTEANINDRGSIERAYPRDAFEEDVRSNMQSNAEVLHGVRVESGAGAGGPVRLMRAAQHVGKDHGSRYSTFLSPFAATAMAGVGDDSPNRGAGDEVAPPESESDYSAFVERIIEAARELDPRPSLGRDERLKGFRGG